MDILVPGRKTAMRTNDTFAGLAIIVLALVMLALTLSFPPFPGQKYGPALFPRLLGAGMILCGLLLILRDRQSQSRQPAVALASWMREPWRVVSFLLMPAVTLLAVLTWDSVGFVPVTLVSLAALFLWFRVTPINAVAIALLATVLLQLFFGKLMRVPLPLGWLLNLPPGWLKYIT
jgi:putative tricarboxylic transport membrane protein